MAKLTFVLEQGQEVVVPLVDAATLTLGRGDDNDVVVDDARVSTHHAALERHADGSMEVCDLNSTAGTFVNGERVATRCSIHDGDMLAFGPLTAVIDLEEQQQQPRLNGHDPGLEHGHAHPPLLQTLPKGVRHPSNHGGNHTMRGGAPSPAAGHEEVARLGAEKARLEGEIAMLQAKLRAQTAAHIRVQSEVAAVQTKLQSWQDHAAREMRQHAVRMETLRVDEKRVAQVKAAVAEVTTLHQQWTAAVQALSAAHADKELEVQRLLAAEAAARQQIDALAACRERELSHQRQLQEEHQDEEAHLATLRQQVGDLEERQRHLEDLVAARDDQVKLVETKLAELAQQRERAETRVKELTGAEEKLQQALERNREADARHTDLLAAMGMLTTQKQGVEAALHELEARLASVHAELKQTQTALEEIQTTKQHTEETLHELDLQVQARQEELAAETAQLEDAAARRADIIQQCEELADTRQELAELDAQMAAAEKRKSEIQEKIAAKESQLQEQEAAAIALHSKEETAGDRLEVLRARENDLRVELENLAANEHAARARFEEIRQLMTEAEMEQQVLAAEHAAKARARQEELDDLEAKLVPLRDWKEAMDKLYSRLAELPENSKAARELWRTIEKEKKALRNLIRSARSQAGGPALKRAPAPERQPPPGVLPDAVIVLTPPEDPLHGSPVSTLQERTLRSRLNHLRECVQREESRLEFLRQERGRHEVRLRPSGPMDEGMQREHERHLETRIRHDEEQLSALRQHIEQAKAEEEKRQARIAEMEHKLAELHANISDAERQRQELRHEADLAHAELKHLESAVERQKKSQADGGGRRKR